MTFEEGAAEEFEHLAELLAERRKQLMNLSLGREANQENFGRMFAIGCVDALLWRLARRANGDDV